MSAKTSTTGDNNEEMLGDGGDLLSLADNSEDDDDEDSEEETTEEERDFSMRAVTARRSSSADLLYASISPTPPGKTTGTTVNSFATREVKRSLGWATVGATNDREGGEKRKRITLGRRRVLSTALSIETPVATPTAARLQRL